MIVTTGNSQPRTFRDKWKTFEQKTKQFIPSVMLWCSVLFLGVAVGYSLFDNNDEAIKCLLLAGLTLGYAVAIPFLAKQKESESRNKET